MNTFGSTLKKVFFANFFSQSLSAIIGIIILPFYSRYFSSEEYGIFMIFYMSFTWVLIFDFGFTNYLNKFSTLYKNGKIEKQVFFKVLSTYEIFFSVLIILIVAFSLIVKICNFHFLPWSIQTTYYSILFILIAVSLKLFTILYKASLDGFYLGNIASYLSVSFLASRYLLPLLFLIFFQLSLTYFLFYQAVVSFIECICYFLIVRLKSGISIEFKNFKFEKAHVFNRFTAFSFANSILYIVITQFDKLLLIKTLPISDYGEYASVIAVTNGIFYLSGPFMSSISPRLIGSIAAGKNILSNLVLNGSFEFTSSIIIGVSFWVGLNGILILKIIKPDILSTQLLGISFLFYAIGNGVYSLIGYLSIPQIAFSNMKFNFVVSIAFAIFTVLGILFIAPRYGIFGLAFFWICKNILLTVFSFVIYSRFNDGINLNKLALILLKKIAINSLLLIPFYTFALKYNSSFFSLIIVAIISFISFFFLNLFISKKLVKYFSKFYRKFIFQ